MRKPLIPWPLWGLLALAFALRATGAVWVEQRTAPPEQFLFGDSDSYWRLGESLAESGRFERGDPPAKIFRTPGYPMVLAALFRIAGPETTTLAARLWSAGFASLVVAGVFWLGERLFDRPVGIIAGLMVAFYPGLVAVAGLILSEGVFCAIVPLQILCWQNAWHSEQRGSRMVWLIAAGWMGGLAALFRPSWLLFTPFAMAMGLLFSTERARQLRSAPLILAGLIIAMLPWWVRNYRAVGEFVPTTLQVGPSLYDGINPQATGASNMDFMAKAHEQAQQAGVADEQREIYLNRQLRDEAVAFAKQNPGRVAKLALVKLRRTWNVIPNEAQFRTPAISWGIAASYLPIVLLGVVGGLRYWRGGLPYALCLMPALYLSLVQMVFIGSIRYRLPAMVLLTVPAAALLVETWRRRQARPTANEPAANEPATTG